MNELIFEGTQDTEDGVLTECLIEAIFSQGDSWQNLREQLKDAIQRFFFDA